MNEPEDETPSSVPPQEDEYNSHCAPSPKDPPETEKSTNPAEQSNWFEAVKFKPTSEEGVSSVAWTATGLLSQAP